MKNSLGHNTTKVRYLVDRISAGISMGKYPIGAALPSINKMSADYDVSRDTVFKALADLKEREIIDSIPGKGYFVKNRQRTILLLLDEYSLFKNELYNSLIKRLSTSYRVDLWFHQYNEVMFNNILRDSIGRYNRYLIMNFDNEKRSPYIDKIDPSRLLLLDFGKFDKGELSYICQDFGDSFYKSLSELTDRLRKYKRLIFFMAKDCKHPKETVQYFVKYCENNRFEYEITDNITSEGIKMGDVFIAVRQADVVKTVKLGRSLNLELGKDYGMIAYNDTPAYEVIDKGITAMSIDWNRMGNMAADFILDNKRVHEYLPTEIHLRNSL